MNVREIRKEIKELKKSIVGKREPLCKAFILGAENTEAEIVAYRSSHPHTRVILLFRRDCGSDVSK